MACGRRCEVVMKRLGERCVRKEASALLLEGCRLRMLSVPHVLLHGSLTAEVEAVSREIANLHPTQVQSASQPRFHSILASSDQRA